MHTLPIHPAYTRALHSQTNRGRRSPFAAAPAIPCRTESKRQRRAKIRAITRRGCRQLKASTHGLLSEVIR